jgi:hypothetical protein
MVVTTERPKIQRVHVTVIDPDKRRGSKTVTLYGMTVDQAVRAIVGEKPAKVRRIKRTAVTA